MLSFGTAGGFDWPLLLGLSPLEDEAVDAATAVRLCSDERSPFEDETIDAAAAVRLCSALSKILFLSCQFLAFCLKVSRFLL